MGTNLKAFSHRQCSENQVWTLSGVSFSHMQLIARTASMWCVFTPNIWGYWYQYYIYMDAAAISSNGKQYAGEGKRAQHSYTLHNIINTPICCKFSGQFSTQSARSHITPTVFQRAARLKPNVFTYSSSDSCLVHCVSAQTIQSGVAALRPRHYWHD